MYRDMNDISKKDKKNNKQTKILIIIFTIFFLIGLSYLAYWYFIGKYLITTEDSYVNANIVNITSRVKGPVTRIYAKTSDKVYKGQKLFEIESYDYLLQLNIAKNNLIQEIKNYNNLKKKLKILDDNIKINRAKYSQLNRIYKRDRKLLKSNSISKSKVLDDADNLKQAKSSLDVSINEYDITKNLVGDKNPKNHNLIKLAINNYKKSYMDYKRTIIYAPQTGYIAKRNIEIGQLIQAGYPTFSLVAESPIWIQANFKETKIKNIKIGQTVKVKIDMHGKTIFNGKVIGIIPGTGPSFSLLPAENATGNWIKIIQRVPVKIQLDKSQLKKYHLMVGLSSKVTIDTRTLAENKKNTAKDYSLNNITTNNNIYNIEEEKINKIIEHLIKKYTYSE